MNISAWRWSASFGRKIFVSANIVVIQRERVIDGAAIQVGSSSVSPYYRRGKIESLLAPSSSCRCQGIRSFVRTYVRSSITACVARGTFLVAVATRFRRRLSSLAGN